jgi:hypothetical protein
MRTQPFQPIGELHQQPTAGGQPDRAEGGAPELLPQRMDRLLCGRVGRTRGGGVRRVLRVRGRDRRCPCLEQLGERRAGLGGARAKLVVFAGRPDQDGGRDRQDGGDAPATEPRWYVGEGPGHRDREDEGEQQGSGRRRGGGAEHAGEQHPEADDGHAQHGQPSDGRRQRAEHDQHRTHHEQREVRPQPGGLAAGEVRKQQHRDAAKAGEQAQLRIADQRSDRQPDRDGDGDLDRFVQRVPLRVVPLEPANDHRFPPLRPDVTG